jgi:hypothetical protein
MNPPTNPDPAELDQALIDAATVGLFSERVGLPLHPWQQRFLDAMWANRVHP